MIDNCVYANEPVFCVLPGEEPNMLPGWYFWDETWSDHGPFATKEEAQSALLNYAEGL